MDPKVVLVVPANDVSRLFIQGVVVGVILTTMAVALARTVRRPD